MHNLGSTFSKLPSSDVNLQLVNDTNYVNYAPAITKDELELYYARILRSSPTQSEICVAVRTSPTANFSAPAVIYASSLIPEAPTVSTDKTKMYYHKKDGALFKLFLRYRNSVTGIEETEKETFLIYPNPAGNLITIQLPLINKKYSVEMYSALGQLVFKSSDSTVINITDFPKGMYSVILKQEGKSWRSKIVKS